MDEPDDDGLLHNALFDWVKHQAGHLSEQIELSKDQERGFCIRVKPETTIVAGTLIARCPTTATLSVLNALDAPGFACQGTLFPPEFLALSCFTVQCFFLMDQHQYGSKSHWYHWFQTLPPPSVTGELAPFQQEDLEWLKGTNLFPALQRKIKDWRAAFDEGLNVLLKLHWQRALDGAYTWDLFRWAAMTFSSRGFSSAVLVETDAADIARPFGKDRPEHLTLQKVFEETFAVLIPVLDILNYRPITQVEWQANVHYIGLRVLEDLKPGQEVCNNYGPKDNEHLLLGYGFTINSNPFDTYTVNISVPVGSPLETVHKQRQTSLRDSNGSPEGPVKKYYYQIFNPSHPTSKLATSLHRAIFSDDLLDAVSTLSANDSELQSKTFQTNQSFLDPMPEERFGRLILSTIAQLQLECEAKALTLRCSEPLRSPTNAMQKYTRTYRHSQLRILEVAAESCRYCLDIGRGIRDGLEEPPEQSTLSQDLSRILGRAPPTMVQGELLDFGSLLQQFWPKLIAPIKIVTEVLYNATTTLRSVDTTTQDRHRSKIAYMIVIYLTMADPGATEGKLRARHWINSMLKWYPSDSLELCSPSVDFVGHLEAIMNADTKQACEAYAQIGKWILERSDDGNWEDYWWDPAKLCWAWNVAEEEGVQIPAGPYLLYVPQFDNAVNYSVMNRPWGWL